MFEWYELDGKVKDLVASSKVAEPQAAINPIKDDLHAVRQDEDDFLVLDEDMVAVLVDCD